MWPLRIKNVGIRKTQSHQFNKQNNINTFFELYKFNSNNEIWKTILSVVKPNWLMSMMLLRERFCVEKYFQQRTHRKHWKENTTQIKNLTIYMHLVHWPSESITLLSGAAVFKKRSLRVDRGSFTLYFAWYYVRANRAILSYLSVLSDTVANGHQTRFEFFRSQTTGAVLIKMIKTGPEFV